MNTLKNVILYGHGGSGNHGCEAIVRSTAQILSKINCYNQPIVASLNSEEDILYGLDSICKIEDIRSGERNWLFWKAYFLLKISGSYEALDSYLLASLIKTQKNSTIALSIGGDNYCYGRNSVFAYQNKLFNNAGIKTVLWGCSIEKAVLENEEGKNDLCNYSLIVARESITFNSLRDVKIPNVHLFPDPAFTLKKKELVFPFKDCVGINLSPMVMDYEEKTGKTFENYIRLIEYILFSTNFNILFIPHVVWPNNDDRIPLMKLFDSYKNSGRVYLVEDNDAEYLKGVISKCRFMIAARTHASIAAYSTCVPTLVVGYSVKAKGIAKDIFGTYDNYVFPVQQLEASDDLIKGFQWLVANEMSIRNHLQEFMPAYIKKAWEAGQVLLNL